MKNKLQLKYSSFFKQFNFTSEYISMISPMTIKCNKCGGEQFFVATRNALKTTKCNECDRIKKHNEFVKYMKVIRPNIKVIGQYVESKKHVDLKCTVCGHEWRAMPFIFTRANREPSDCPNCANRIITLDSIKLKLKKLNPDITIISKVFNKTHERLKLICNKCGNEWEIEMYKIFSNDRSFPVCQKCSSRIKVSDEQFKENLNNTKVEILGEFTNYKTKIDVKCKKCGYEWQQLPSNLKKNGGCPICAKKTSKYEQEIYDWLVSIGITNIDRNKYYFKDGKRFEADLFLPDFNLAIDFHGLYFHSNVYKEKNYHLDKLDFFTSLNINFIQIFENEWLSKQEIVKSIVKRKLNMTEKIYARKCVVREISLKETKNFCEAYHLQGYSKCAIRIGMFYSDELVSVMTVGANRFKQTDVYELIRYTCHPLYSVTGGMKKMLAYLKNEYQINELDSFIERRYFNGAGYLNAGFKLVGVSVPNYFYFKSSDPTIIYNRMMFQKAKLHKKLKIFDDKLSEYENMMDNGFLRIYDCGNIKVQIILKK